MKTTLTAAAALLALAVCAAGQCTAPCQTGQTNYKHECIANVDQDCSALPNKNCPACGLYLRDALPYVGQTTAHITLPGTAHSLAVPTYPCRGVEDSAKPQCGDAVYDAAWGAIATADKATKGMAINPSNRRTFHQMHVHIATIQPALKEVLYQIANHQSPWTYIDCQTTPNHQATSCKVSSTATAIQAKWYPTTAGNPSAVSPFRVTYTSNPGPPNTAQMTQLVASPKPGGFVILEATDRPAECLLTCGADCEGKCST